MLNETDARHWPCPGTPSPGGGRQTFKDTLEQLVKLYCVMGRGGAAWEASGGELTGPGGPGGLGAQGAMTRQLEGGRAEDQPASGRRCL